MAILTPIKNFFVSVWEWFTGPYEEEAILSPTNPKLDSSLFAAEILPQTTPINAKSGRYIVTLTDGNTAVIDATPDDMTNLYKKLVDPKQVSRTYVAYSWIDPTDYKKFPVTNSPTDFANTGTVTK